MSKKNMKKKKKKIQKNINLNYSPILCWSMYLLLLSFIQSTELCTHQTIYTEYIYIGWKKTDRNPF